MSQLLSELVDAYPVPIDEMALVGYSMGGLVARSAAPYAHQRQSPWIARLRRIRCIGTPHHGSPHAKAAAFTSRLLRNLDAAAPQVIADLLETRSGGIRDLEYGAIVGNDPSAGNDPPAPEAGRPNPLLVDGVEYSFVAATVTRDPNHPVGRLLGDFFVRLPSATGGRSDPARRIPFHNGRIFHGLDHFDLTHPPEVYAAVRDQLGAAAPAARALRIH